MLKSSDLSPAQNRAYRDILKLKRMCISSDCGFGKTIAGLTAFRVLQKRRPESKGLFVCNPEGVKNTWSKEHLKWAHTRKLKVVALLGTPKQRLELLSQPADIYTITYGTLSWLNDVNKGKNKINFNFVFADEGDCLKGPTSKFRRNLLWCAPKAKYRIISSATPKTREEDDYWGLCKFLDNGKSLNAKTVEVFRAKYCSSFMVNKRQMWRINAKRVNKLEKRIAHLFHNYELSDQASIPIKTITVKRNLSRSAMAKYNQLQEEQCVNSIIYKDSGAIDDDKSLDALVISGKLAQLSSGFLYVDDNLRITPDMLARCTNVKSLINKSKRKVPVDVFHDRIRLFSKLIMGIYKKHGYDQNIVVPYFYQHELTQLKRLLPSALCDTDPDFQNRWNAGDERFLLLQYNRSSKSLNLQSGGSIMAFYSPTFRWCDDYQIVRRLARQGQLSKCVYAYRLYLNHTIDEIKTKRLEERFTGHSRFQKQVVRRVYSHSP